MIDRRTGERRGRGAARRSGPLRGRPADRRCPEARPGVGRRSGHSASCGVMRMPGADAAPGQSRRTGGVPRRGPASCDGAVTRRAAVSCGGRAPTQPRGRAGGPAGLGRRGAAPWPTTLRRGPCFAGRPSGRSFRGPTLRTTTTGRVDRRTGTSARRCDGPSESRRSRSPDRPVVRQRPFCALLRMSFRFGPPGRCPGGHLRARRGSSEAPVPSRHTGRPSPPTLTLPP